MPAPDGSPADVSPDDPSDDGLSPLDMADDDLIVTSSNRSGRRVPTLEVDGLDESEILGQAPVMTCDRVHWDTVGDFDATQILADLPMMAWSRQWSDGQHRIWVPEGEGYEARELIRAWCEEHQVEAVNMRVEAGVPFRDLDLISGGLVADLIAAAVEWLYPRMQAIRRQLVADLDLIDDEDVRSMMFLFVSDHLDRFDERRRGRNGTLPLLVFLIGKLRTWPQDLARSMYGRGVVADRIALAKAGESIAATEQRPATESELADALGISVTDLRQREQAIGALSNMRNHRSLAEESRDGEFLDTVQVSDDVDVEFDATAHARNAELTRAIMSAVNDPTSTGKRAQDPLALAAVYLSFWEELSRPDVARELEVLPKTAAAAVSRVLDSVSETGLE